MNRHSRSPKTFALALRTKIGTLIRSGRLGGAAAMLAVLATSATASAGDRFWGIVSTVRTSPKTMARINVSELGAGAAIFTVFPPNNAIPILDVVESIDLFASSASSTKPEISNLFTGIGQSTGLVLVESSGVQSGAVLEQSSWDGKLELSLPPEELAKGMGFVVPIGDLQQGTSLLVGNPHDVPVDVSVRYGNNLPEPIVTIQRVSVAVIDITRSNIGVVLEARSNLPVIAQLAVDTGKTTVMTYLTPLSPFQ